MGINIYEFKLIAFVEERGRNEFLSDDNREFLNGQTTLRLFRVGNPVL
jgi:hypothetical protein